MTEQAPDRLPWLESAADDCMAEDDSERRDRPLGAKLPPGIIQSNVTVITKEDGNPVHVEFSAKARDGAEFTTTRVVPHEDAAEDEQPGSR
jgi:hypothetical protein